MLKGPNLTLNDWVLLSFFIRLYSEKQYEKRKKTVTEGDDFDSSDTALAWKESSFHQEVEKNAMFVVAIETCNHEQ